MVHPIRVRRCGPAAVKRIGEAQRVSPARVGAGIALDRRKRRARALIGIVEHRGSQPVGSLALDRQQAGAETRERIAFRPGNRLLLVVVQAGKTGAEECADRTVDDVEEQQRGLGTLTVVWTRPGGWAA